MSEASSFQPAAALSNPPRVLSGMRPTGRLHLGNYMGALHNWISLQNQRTPDGQPAYHCFFFIADWHALTTDYADPSRLRQNVFEIALDFLAAGLDPAQSTIFIQSHVPEHAELNLLLSMITPVSWLERVPTYKDQQEQLREKDLATYGFLGYPLLQSADILLYLPHFVPVGADQVAHVEITREIARRFNQLYPGDFLLSPDAAPWELPAIQTRARKLSGNPTQEHFTPHQLFEAAKQTKKLSPFRLDEIIPEPDVLLTPSPKLPGLDGRKMSKSYGNTIALDDSEETIRARLKTMVTDPARVRREDPGNPEVCPVGDLHKVFSPPDLQSRVWQGCTTAGIGCIECKSWLADEVVRIVNPIRDRRNELAKDQAAVWQTLEQGAERARDFARGSMRRIRDVVGLP